MGLGGTGGQGVPRGLGDRGEWETVPGGTRMKILCKESGGPG